MRIGDLRHLASGHRGLAGFAIGVVAAATLTGGGVALAAIPSNSTGQYTACVLKRTGTVRIIDSQAGKRCRAKEKTVSWSKGWQHRGTWSAGVGYAVGDVVVQNGSSFVAKIRSRGAAPSATPTAWGLLAQAAATGTPGPAGPAGPAGPVGAAGPAGPVAVHYALSGPLFVNAGEQASGDAPCPAGESVIGGGAIVSSADTAVGINSSYPFDGDGVGAFLPNSGWTADVNNASAAGSGFAVYAICTKASSASVVP
jgi:hypothetical protein